LCRHNTPMAATGTARDDPAPPVAVSMLVLHFLSHLPRMHNRLQVAGAPDLRLPFQPAVCYKGASIANRDTHDH